MLIFCVKNGNHQDVEKFLGFYLDALDEELFELHNHISTHKPAPGPKVDGVEEDAESGGGQTEVGKRDYKRSSGLFSPSLSLTLLTYAWTRIDKITHLAHIRRNIPFDRTCAKPVRRRHLRSLAVTPTRHPGPFLCSPPARAHVLVTKSSK